MSDAARPPSSSPRRKKAAAQAPRSKPRARRITAAAGALSPRLKAVLLAAAAMLGTLAVATAVLLLGFGRSKGPARAGAAVEIDWPEGIGSEEAAALLAEKGLVESRDTMTIFLRATGGTTGFAAGPHLLPEGATPWELRRLLARSFLRPSAKLTIPEGYNRFDIAARVEKLRIAGRRAFLAATTDQALLDELGIERGGQVGAESAEGYLFPATYEFGLDSDPRDVVRRLVAEANKRWESVLSQRQAGLASLRASLGWGRREVLTLASIIEKEAAVDDERPIIASVFLNRLLAPDFRPRRLQSDPTSSYGCVAWPAEAPSCAEFQGKPTPAINRDAKNRYSTYAHEGLPPGPIANPGARSIEAVLAPSATRFFYFVAAGGGRHTFSESLDAHNDAVHRGRAP